MNKEMYALHITYLSAYGLILLINKYLSFNVKQGHSIALLGYLG